MPIATIDGKKIEVESGTTILEAAGLLGIEIPTLCYVKGLEPAASCFLCAVQVEGMPRLSPSCALEVTDGMAVSTDSPDVRAARKMALELLLSDHAGDCIAPCQARCPAGLDVGSFVYQMASGNLSQSMEIIYRNLALPGSLGRVCPRLCEQGCRRCDLDEGLAIADLHRYPTDRNFEKNDPFIPRKAPPTGKKVAIVGAGPAGLSAAFYLQQKGHQCTVFDSQPHAGGMLYYGIPDYRLPKKALHDEVQVIQKLGAVFRMNSTWGIDFSLKDLRESFDAVFIGIGAWKSQGLRCKGEHLAVSGIEFLENVTKEHPPALGDHVVVIGGGNTAMDASRTALRLGSKVVQVIYRRTRQEMPCLMEEVEDAELEGVTLDFLAAPVELRKKQSGQLELICQRMKLGEPDDSGRRRPVPITGSEYTVECSSVIAAIGQSVNLILAEDEGLEVNRWGIVVDPKTMAASIPGVFAGGDAVLGADLAVRAVAAGRIASVSIDQYLNRKPVTGPSDMVNIAMRTVSDLEKAAFFRAVEKSPRPRNPILDMKIRRTTFTEVNPGLSEAVVVSEASRCMTCGCRKADDCQMRMLATEYQADPYRFSGERRQFSQDTTHPEIIYEPGKCILCDACVRIAAEAGEELGVAAIGRGFRVAMGVPFAQPLSEGLRRAALKAAENCPTGALAVRTSRSCDLGTCAKTSFADPSSLEGQKS